MKLVSAAKLRRAQDAALNGRLFSEKLAEVLAEVIKELPADFDHPLLERRSEIRKRRVVMVSGERGLCGAYNANVLKAIQSNESIGIGGSSSVELIPLGKQAGSAVRRFGWETVALEQKMGEDANIWPISELAERLIKDYIEHKYDELVIYYTKFVSAMTQSVTREVLLPFTLVREGAAEAEQKGVTSFDPAPEEIILKLFPLLLGTQVRQAGLEAKASEHAARMTAMDAATRNADDLIGKLKLFYNRARQTAITRELIDIVGGAEAIK